MGTSKLLSLTEYSELFVQPLQASDERSFHQIEKMLRSTTGTTLSPVCFLIETLTGITISQREARNHWKKILEHKRRIELALSRTVNIRTAAIDYYDQLGIFADSPTNSKTGGLNSTGPNQPGTGDDSRKNPSDPLSTKDVLLYQFIRSHEGKSALESDIVFERLSSPGYYQERLKEEMMRARRYKHALSVILFDVELKAISGTSVSPEIRDKTLKTIVKMINKTIRTVDILALYSGNLFLLILPNTNKREAMELAERLKNNILQRTSKIPELGGGIPVTLAVGQCMKDDASIEFAKRLENLVTAGKKKAINAVYNLE